MRKGLQQLVRWLWEGTSSFEKFWDLAHIALMIGEEKGSGKALQSRSETSTDPVAARGHSVVVGGEALAHDAA